MNNQPNTIDIQMFRNANTLSELELKKLQILFTKYYIERYERISRFWQKNDRASLIKKLHFYHLAKKDIDDIKSGKNIAFVRYSGCVPVGFIVGSLDGWKEATLSKYYVSTKNPSEARLQTLELYRVFSKEMRARGASTMVAISDMGDNVFINALETLDFDCLGEDYLTIKYGKRIQQL